MEKTTILYVDDELDNLQVFKSAFRRKYDVITTQSPEEALQHLQEKEIPVIITDQRMPEMTGIELLAKLPPKIETVRMILTGFSDVEAIIDAINRCNVYQYITKPWNRDELGIIIDNAVQRYQLTKANKTLMSNLELANNRLKQQNEALEIAHAKAIAASQAKQEFLGKVSHELRTPMNAIMGFTHLLLEDNPTEDQRFCLENLDASNKIMLQTIDNLLNLIDLETKQASFDHKPFNIRTLLQNLISTHQENNDNAALEIRLDTDLANLPQQLVGDAKRLRQILDNLMSNAVKFTKQGHAVLQVTCTAQNEKNARLYFKIEDTGIGISEEMRESIFDAFSQVSTSVNRTYDGLGLGLPVAKWLIELHNSQITLESEVGKGSTFSFELSYPTVL